MALKSRHAGIRSHRALPVLLALLLGGALAGCPSGGSDEPPPVDQRPRLEARVNELIRAWVADRYDIAYDSLEPSYRRLIEKKQYEKRDRVKVLGAELAKVQMEGTSASVELNVTTEDRISKEPRESTVDQRWILEDGEWYLAQPAD